jgi:hypothetical protein
MVPLHRGWRPGTRADGGTADYVLVKGHAADGNVLAHPCGIVADGVVVWRRVGLGVVTGTKDRSAILLALK